MARVFDEKLESGYEESGGTTTTGSATLDPNTAVSAAGSPSGWGSYCLYADADPDGAAYRYYNPTFPTTFYFRDEVVIDSHALVNDNDQATFAYVGANASTAAFILFIRKVSGSIKFMARITTSATHVDYYSDNAISLGTRYRIEVKYDIDNDQWEWRVDGVTQDSGTLATGHPTTLGHMRIGANPVANKAIAVYHDNVAIDNADWVGEEVSTIAASASDGVTLSDSPTVATGDALYYASGSPESTEYYVTANFTFNSTGAAWLVGRLSGNSYYFGGWSGSRWELWKCVDGSETLLGYWADSPTGTVSVVLSLRSYRKELIIAGTSRISDTDNEVSGAGVPGLRTGGGDGIKFDNYNAYNYTIIDGAAADGITLFDTPIPITTMTAVASDGVTLTEYADWPYINASASDGIVASDVPAAITEVGGPVDPVDARSKTVDWFFDVTDNQAQTYKWSTKKQGAYSFKVINFPGMNLRRNQTEDGIIAPSTLRFSITNANNAIDPSDLEGGTITLTLVINVEEVIKWTFRIKQALSSYQEIDIECEDFLAAYLDGEWPNTPQVSELFPDDMVGSNLVVPVTFGTAYIPLQSVLSSGQRYYVLGPSDKTYTISEVRTPREFGRKTVWNSNDFTFTQSDKTDSRSETWKVFQAIIADSDADGTADANGLWKSGDSFLPLPTKFTRSDTATLTNPADILEFILLDMGVPAAQIDSADSASSFSVAAATFDSLGLSFNMGYYYQRPRKEVLAELLAACHSVFRITDKVELHILSKTSVRTVTAYDIIKKQDVGKGTFQIRDIRDFTNDAGYVAIPNAGDSQDGLYRILVPAKNSWNDISEDSLNLPMLTDSADAQTAGALYFQRRFLKDKAVFFNSKATLAKVYPDQVITISGTNYGGTYKVLVDEVHIGKELELSFSCIKFTSDLDDWGDLAFSPISVTADGSLTVWETVTVGPDTSTPSSGSPPNLIPGRLFVGTTILLDPASGGKLHIGDIANLSNNVAFNIGDKLFFNEGTATLTVGGWVVTPTKISATGIEIDSSTPHIKAYAGSNKVEMTAAGLEGYDSVLGQTFMLPTNGDPPTFSSGIIREVVYEMYTSGVIKTSTDPTADGGLLANNTRLACYDDSSVPIKTFEVIYNGVDVGDVLAGDYENGNHGVHYDHSTGKFNVHGEVITKADDGSYSELSAGALQFVDATGGYSFAYTKRVVVGSASDGDYVSFTPNFRSLPTVVLSPTQLQTFENSSSANDQQLLVRPYNLTEAGFSVQAKLIDTSGGSAQETMTPSVVTQVNDVSLDVSTASDITEVWAHVTILGWQKISSQIDYTAEAYKITAYPKRITLKFEYRNSGGTWTDLGNTTYTHFPTSSNYASGMTYTKKLADGLSALQYDVRITLISIANGDSAVEFYAATDVSAPTTQAKDLTADYRSPVFIGSGDVDYIVIGN